MSSTIEELGSQAMTIMIEHQDLLDTRQEPAERAAYDLGIIGELWEQYPAQDHWLYTIADEVLEFSFRS